MDHPGEFGWRGLSLCDGPRLVDEMSEVRKRARREEVERIKRKWRNDKVEWVPCRLVGWNEEVERFLQRLFNDMG